MGLLDGEHDLPVPRRWNTTATDPGLQTDLHRDRACRGAASLDSPGLPTGSGRDHPPPDHPTSDRAGSPVIDDPATSTGMVVVGCADTPSGHAAAAFAAGEARLRGTPLRLVLAYQPDVDSDAVEFEMDPERRHERARRDAQDVTDALAERLGDQLPPLEVVVEQGPTAAVLLAAASAASVLVLGVRPDGLLNRLLRPSTAAQVLRQAHLPVVIVPQP